MSKNEGIARQSGIRESFGKFASSTSAHGFQYTVEGSPYNRVIAVIIVLVFVVIAGTFTVSAIKDYMEGPGFNSEYKLVYTKREEPQPLDVFAICDISPWDFNKAKAANISVEMISFLSYYIFSFEVDRATKDQDKLAKLDTEYKVLVDKFGSTSNLLDAVTRSCEQTIFYCKLGTSIEQQGGECCEKNFNPAVYTTEGKCWGTAGRMAYRQPFPSKPYGLTIGLSIGVDVSGSLDTSVGPLQAAFHRGIAVVLTGAKDHLVPAAAKRAYLTLPNTLNSVALEKTVIDSSGLETCVNADDHKIIADKTRGFRRYSKDNCEINHLQLATMEHLGCALTVLPNPDNITECSPLQTLLFFEELGRRVGGWNVESGCPLDCIQEDYRARLTSQQVTPTVSAILALMTNDTEDRDIVAFQIHYPSFDFIQTVQHATVS